LPNPNFLFTMAIQNSDNLMLNILDFVGNPNQLRFSLSTTAITTTILTANTIDQSKNWLTSSII